MSKGLKALDAVPIFKGPGGLWKSPDGRTKDQKTVDGFQNFMAKLGLSSNPSEAQNLLSHGHYEFNLLTRNRLQLEAAYRGSWIVGQVVDTIAEDMTRAGVQCTTDKEAEAVSDFQAYQTRMQIWQSLREAIQWGRLYGGCVAMMEIDGQKLDSPLAIDAVEKGQFKGLIVYDRWQIWPVLTEVITSGPNMGLPAYYDIVTGTNLNDPGMEPGGQRTDEMSGRIRVHHSRCIRMDGIKLPFFQAITEMMWGESVLERMWDRLIAFDDATMNTAGLIHRALLRTIGVDSLREILAAGGEAQQALIAMFDMMREMQSNEGITLIDKNDEFAATPYTFAGLSDVMIQLGQQVSGAAQIPLIRLFGQTPVGLSSDGSGDIRLYYDGVLAKQEAKLRNPLIDLFKVMWRSFRGKPLPKDFDFKFVPLWQMTALDKATVAKTNTETLIEAHQEGALDTASLMRELKQNSVETGLFTHITDEDIEEAENEEPPMPGEAGGEQPGEPGSGPKIPQTSVKTPKQSLPTAKDSKGVNVAEAAWKKIRRFLSKDTMPLPWNEVLGFELIREGVEGLRKKRALEEKRKKARDEDVSDAQYIKDWLNRSEDSIEGVTGPILGLTALAGIIGTGVSALELRHILQEKGMEGLEKLKGIGAAEIKKVLGNRANDEAGSTKDFEPLTALLTLSAAAGVAINGTRLFHEIHKEVNYTTKGHDGLVTGSIAMGGIAYNLLKKKKKAGKDVGIPETMREFSKGKLKSSSGKTVTNKKQALAIGYSEENKDMAKDRELRPSERKNIERNYGVLKRNRDERANDARKKIADFLGFHKLSPNAMRKLAGGK